MIIYIKVKAVLFVRFLAVDVPAESNVATLFDELKYPDQLRKDVKLLVRHPRTGCMYVIHNPESFAVSSLPEASVIMRLALSDGEFRQLDPDAFEE